MRYDVKKVGDRCWQIRKNGTVLGTEFCEEKAWMAAMSFSYANFKKWSRWRDLYEVKVSLFEEILVLESERAHG